jgi:cell division protease FtsH
LENVLNEAALLAARRDKWTIEWQDVEEARDKVMMGLVREGLAPTEEESRFIAYHEAGHAILAAVLPNADPTHKVTIVPRGMAMGATQQLPERERFIYTREYLMDQLTVMMGGRAAETVIFGTAASGAENDLKHATQLARQMVLDWGMSERLGHVALGDEPANRLLGSPIGRERAYSETTAREIDEEVKEILEEAYQQASTTLRRYRSELDAVADALLAREELTGEEVLALVKGRGVPATASQRPARNGAGAVTAN